MRIIVSILSIGNSFSQDALTSDNWDYVAIQQVSHQSVDYAIYYTYLNNLSISVVQQIVNIYAVIPNLVITASTVIPFTA